MPCGELARVPALPRMKANPALIAGFVEELSGGPRTGRLYPFRNLGLSTFRPANSEGIRGIDTQRGGPLTARLAEGVSSTTRARAVTCQRGRVAGGQRHKAQPPDHRRSFRRVMITRST